MARQHVGYTPKSVGCLEAYKLYWKNAFDFNGRASLTEYWYPMIWQIIFSMAISVLFVVFFMGSVFSASGQGEAWMGAGIGLLGFSIIVVIWEIINFIPSLSIAVRRLHDTGKSGLFMLLMFAWGIGPIVLLIFLALPSDRNQNKYN